MCGRNQCEGEPGPPPDKTWAGDSRRRCNCQRTSSSAEMTLTSSGRVRQHQGSARSSPPSLPTLQRTSGHESPVSGSFVVDQTRFAALSSSFFRHLASAASQFRAFPSHSRYTFWPPQRLPMLELASLCSTAARPAIEESGMQQNRDLQTERDRRLVRAAVNLSRLPLPQEVEVAATARAVAAVAAMAVACSP